MAAKKKNAAPASGSVVHLHVGEPGAASDREADEAEIADIDALEEGALSRAIEEVRNLEGAKAEVHRVLPAERAGYCRVYAVSVFSHERIASDWGPGKYRVRFKGPGDKYIKGGGTFDIAEGLTPATPPGGPGAVTEVLALFKAEREREKEAAEKKKGEWLEWAKIIAPLALPKILEMIGGRQSLSPRDLVGMMKDMKELQAPAADLNSQFNTVLSVLQGAKELVGDDGGGKTGSTWVDLLRDVLQGPAMGAIASMVPGMMGGRPGLTPSPLPLATLAPPTQPPASAGPPGPAASSGSAPSTAPASSPDMLQELSWLRGTVTQLLLQAGKGANPRLYAEVVLDNMPPFISDADLLKRLAADEWYAQLQMVDARIAQHQEWFTKFRDYAVKALTRRLRKATEANMPNVPQGPGINQPTEEGDPSD